jgi:hypothetical protein
MDPAFEAKLVDIVGLYMDPPERAAVFLFRRKTQVQALDRTQPSLPLRPGRAGTMTPHDTGDHPLQRESPFTAGRPTSSSHTRVASVSTGAPRIGWLQNLPILGAPVPRPVGPSRYPTPRLDPRRRVTRTRTTEPSCNTEGWHSLPGVVEPDSDAA